MLATKSEGAKKSSKPASTDPMLDETTHEYRARLNRWESEATAEVEHDKVWAELYIGLGARKPWAHVLNTLQKLPIVGRLHAFLTTKQHSVLQEFADLLERRCQDHDDWFGRRWTLP